MAALHQPIIGVEANVAEVVRASRARPTRPLLLRMGHERPFGSGAQLTVSCISHDAAAGTALAIVTLEDARRERLDRGARGLGQHLTVWR